MKILSIILALFATSFVVHAQTYTKAELTQAAYNIQQGHNEGAKICLTYKAQVEASKAWTEEIRQNYLFAIQSLLEYYSMQKRYTDEEELLNHAIALYNTRDSITNNPQTRALHTIQTRVQFDKKNYDALIGYAKKALNMYNAVGDHGIDYCILCCNTAWRMLSKTMNNTPHSILTRHLTANKSSPPSSTCQSTWATTLFKTSADMCT